VQVLALKLGKLRSEQRDTALNIPKMAQNFRSPEINHRHLVEDGPAFVQISSRDRIAAHPATRLMDLGRGLNPCTTSSPIAGAVALDRCNTLLHKTLLRGGRWAFPARLPANRGPVRTCGGSAPVWADWPTLFTSCILPFAVSKSIIVTRPAFVQISQRRGRAAHPATRLMDLGRGLDPYTTKSPIAVRGSPTLVPDLNRAINNGEPA